MTMDFEGYRYERKFVIREFMSYEIEHLIKSHPAGFHEIFYQRNVNNIYLDYMDMNNYADHTIGNSNRLKIRIRWYGKMFGEIQPVLELKIKKNELGKKMSFPLKPFKFNRDFSSDFLKKEIFEKSNLPKWLVEELKTCSPVLLNSYKRKYFISKDKAYRITLDTDLKFFKINQKNNLFYEKIVDRDNSILELKYDGKDYRKASHITENFPFRLSKLSKYIQGIEVLELC